MSYTLEIILYRSNSQEHPRWSQEQVVGVARDTAEGQDRYAGLLTDLQAAADK